MKKRISYVVGTFLFLLIIQQGYSSGAIRLVLPYLTGDFTLSTMSNGELAYDTSTKKVIVKIDGLAEELNPTPEEPVRNVERFPHISSAPSSDFFNDASMVYSKIGKGAIYIGNDFLVNSTEIVCKYSSSGTISNGPGAFDGSVRQGSFTMYLYLIKDGSNFNCILSYNSNGPESPYDSNWILAQTILGVVETEGNVTTHIGGYRMILIDSNTVSSPNAFPEYIAPSMKAIYFQGVNCPAQGMNFKLQRPYVVIDDYTGQTTTSYLLNTENRCAYCDEATDPWCKKKPGVAERYDLLPNNEIYFEAATGPQYELLFNKWIERQLRSN
ncbi:hypothetical protein [Halobacteriovorax sp. RZ-2]|uniref:hypothetical protein n=1 Tax=unclassified Halobacteriovorax TaxID=2639665 RepID=UPI003716C609